MGNRRAREFALQREDDAAWRQVYNEPRLAIDDVHARGIGMRRLQLLCLPSFDEPMAFEIRQAGDEWRLFRSRVVESWPTLRLVGYEEISMASNKLAALFARATSLSLPLAPYLNGCGVIDGTTYHLAVFGDMSSEWRIQWWSESPPQWRPLVELVKEMLDLFTSSSNSGHV
jgi:hypothetical protein